MVSSTSKSTFPKNAAHGKRVAIVVARYHEALTQRLLTEAEHTLKTHGVQAEDLQVVWVPGSFELPQGVKATLIHADFDAVIALGVLVKGETSHNEYIAQAVAQALTGIGLASGTPVIFGVLTPDTLEQAEERLGGKKGHKGTEAAEAAIGMMLTFADLKNSPKRSSKSVGFGS